MRAYGGGMSDEVPKREDPIYQAQAILARRDHTEHEVRTKLGRKGFIEQQVDEAVAWLKRHKLLNDERFAQVFVESTLIMKPVGPRWFIHKLRQKGVRAEFIEPAVYGVIDDAKEAELAMEAGQAWRRRQGERPLDRRDRDRLMRFLVSRGFSYEAAVAVVDVDSSTSSETT